MKEKISNECLKKKTSIFSYALEVIWNKISYSIIKFPFNFYRNIVDVLKKS